MFALLGAFLAAAQYSETQKQDLLEDIVAVVPQEDLQADDFEDVVFAACEHCDEDEAPVWTRDDSYQVSECLCLLELVEGRSVQALWAEHYFDTPLEERADAAAQTLVDDPRFPVTSTDEALKLRMTQCARFAARPMPWFQPHVAGFRQCCSWQHTLAKLDQEHRAGVIFPRPAQHEREGRCKEVQKVQAQTDLAAQLQRFVLLAEKAAPAQEGYLQHPRVRAIRSAPAPGTGFDLFPRPQRKVRHDGTALVEVGGRVDLFPALQKLWQSAVATIAAAGQIAGPAVRALPGVCVQLFAKLGQMLGQGMVAVLRGAINTFRAVTRWALSGVGFSDDNLRVWPWCHVVPVPNTLRNRRVC